MIRQTGPKRPTSKPNAAPPILAHRREGAAAALSISVKLLDELTADGTLPHVRLGKRVVLYPVAALETWLADEARKAVRP